MLLFDEQLSEELCLLLRDLYPGAMHVRHVRLGGASDSSVWAFASANGLTLVSKDEDFHRLSVLRGAPPKFIWLRLGNCTTLEVADLIRRERSVIQEFHEQDERSVLELG